MLTMNYTYRITPTDVQQELMLGWLETCRRLYNRCLRDLKDWLNSRKCSLYSCSTNREYIMSADIPFPGYLEQKRQLTQWKKTNPWLKEVHSQVTQDCVKRLHNTWQRFKSKKFGFPRFKTFGRYQSFLFPQFKESPIKDGLIRLPRIGEVEINLHRPIPEGFKVKGVRIVSRVRRHNCSECGYQTNRDHASGRVILNRGLNTIVPVDYGERKPSGNGVLSGVSCLDKCRSRNANSRGLEAYTVFFGSV